MPFTTHEGFGLGECVRDANVKSGLAIYGSNAADSRDAVEKWIKESLE